MGFFRSTWLQRILIFLILALLNARGFGFVAKQDELNNKAAINIIYDTPCLVQIKYSVEKLKIVCFFDIFNILDAINFKVTISRNYILETASSAVSFDPLTCLKRGPPRSMTLF